MKVPCIHEVMPFTKMQYHQEYYKKQEYETLIYH